MQIVLYHPLIGRSFKGRISEREDVAEFINRNKAKVLAEFVEVKTGLKQLRRALDRAKQDGVMLVISHVGPRAKNLSFVEILAETDVDFVAIDNRTFNRKVIDRLLVLAQKEFHVRRERIKDAMADKKAQGAKFGTARPGAWAKRDRGQCQNAAAASVAARRARADDAYALILPQMVEMRAKGESYETIANALNEAGHLTTTGTPFSIPTVFKLLKRHGGHNGNRARKASVGRKTDHAAVEQPGDSDRR